MFWGGRSGKWGLIKKRILLDNGILKPYHYIDFNGFVIGRAVKKTRFYCLGSAKFHERVSVRTGCTDNPIRNSIARNNRLQTPLEVSPVRDSTEKGSNGASRQLLTGQKKQISPKNTGKQTSGNDTGVF